MSHHRQNKLASSLHTTTSHSDVASPDSGPAQRYREFRDRQQYRHSAAARFESQAPFEFDDFQREANNALESGHNVLVAAPTGAGKTVIADFAIFLAQEHNAKAFYTTPIKALSNQKYHDLVDRYGSERVGLLTGDISINPEADIVVMTTEVLRNMIYERSTTLQALRYVVLDEVHYLADRFRGPVWEEVIVQLPPSVRIIALSATVSNVEDFSSWIESVRGSTHLVVSEHRPVPLDQHVIVQADAHSEPELIDLYRRDRRDRLADAVNPALASRLDQLDRRAERQNESHRHESTRHGHRSHNHESALAPRYVPRRWAVVDELDYLHMLPGIYFIFSRNGCDQAVDQCVNAGLKLTTQGESLRIRRIVDDMVEGQLPADDLKALGFSRFRFALEEGFAAHHAGMVALFREIVEHLFELGLIKMVFATETLALGINMPARSVIVEKLEKFNGSEHVMLTPGEFTQLTGRAGRRGIDPLGHAVVVDHRDFAPAALVALSSKRVYPLHSSFKATFNMAVNLLANSDYTTARTILDRSFAQWEANESAWQLQSRITKLREAISGYEQALHCEYGDFKQLMLIRRKLNALEKGERQRLRHQLFASNEERLTAMNDLETRIRALRAEDRNHPCRSCPELAKHLEIVPMDRTDVIQPHDTTSRDLTLTTCWPVMSPTPATHRLIIHAVWVGWAPVSDGTPAELAGVHETTTDRTVRTVKTVARRLSMPVTQTMAASLALMWAVLDGLAWLIWHRRMRDVWRRPVADPLTCLFRLQAGPTAVRVVLFALMWAAVAFACFKWMCPALADAIPMFADPHPAV